MAKLTQIHTKQVWLLGAVVLILIPHFSHQHILVTLVNLAFIIWRFLYEVRILSLPKQSLRIILALASFVGVGLIYQSVLGLFAGSALLTVMLCLKLLEMKNWRDTVVVIGLGYFVTVTNFLFTQSLFMGVYLILVVIVLTTTLIAFNRNVSVKAENLEIVKLATTILIHALPLAILLFFLFPRIPGPLWSLPNDAHSGMTGLSESMTPGNISQLTDNKSTAFRVTFSDTLPDNTQLYWRGPVFNRFDGQTWRNANSSSADYKSTAEMLKTQLDIPSNASSVDYNVILEPHNKRWLFVLDMPTSVPVNAFLTREFELLKTNPIRQLTRYRAKSNLHYRLQARELKDIGRYLQLPNRTAPKSKRFIKNLMDDLGPVPDSDARLVDKVLDFFRLEAFFYTQNPPRIQGDSVDEFLFETRKGFCEHYASSFVVLMRAASIPARVVTGYQGGEFNNVGNYWAVKQSDAHAWAEVWLENQGWVRIDPTAVIPSHRVEYSTHVERFSPRQSSAFEIEWLGKAWRNLSYGWDNINYYWKIWIVGYDDKQQESFLSWLGLEDIQWQELTIILFSTLGIVLFVTTIVILRRNRRKPQDLISVTYNRYCKKLARLGVILKPGETAKQLTIRAAHVKPELSDFLFNIVTAYNRLKYSESPQPALLKQFTQAVSTLRIDRDKTSANKKSR